MEVAGWYPFAAGSTIGEMGTESGIILRDEELKGCVLITLERESQTPAAITCGIYGRMVHTRYCSTEEEANKAFVAIKVVLARIVDLIPSNDDTQANDRAAEAVEELYAFTTDFPRRHTTTHDSSDGP